MRRTAIGFTSQGLKLEGVLSVPEDLSARAPGAPGVSETSGNLPAILMCHPHPKLGGDMESPVVLAVCGAAAREGIASMRFNFRGVGDSEGAFSDGEGEQKDMEAALSVLRRWPGIDGKRLAVAGYSFGAAVILDGLKLCKPAQSFALIAPPVSSVRRSRIGRDRRPRLFVRGQPGRDIVVRRPAARTRRHRPGRAVRGDPGRRPRPGVTRGDGRRARGRLRQGGDLVMGYRA